MDLKRVTVKILLFCLGVAFSMVAHASDVTDMDAAVRSKDIEAVSALLNKGVSAGIVLNEGKNAIWKHSPLILAVKTGNMPLVELLIQKGAEVNYVNAGSTTALKEAVISDNAAITVLLVDADANVDFIDENEVPILFWAVSNESKAVIPLLIDAGTDPDKEFDSFLHGKTSVREYFIQKGETDDSVLNLLGPKQ